MVSRQPLQLARLAVVGIAELGLSVSARADGRFASPSRGEMVAAGSAMEVRWAAPCPDGANETEVLLSVDGGLTFPIRLTPEMAACAKGFRWEVPALSSAHARIALRAGSGEASENERLYLVSDEFTILDGSDDDSEDLVPGARELWTRQALEGSGVEEPPAPSLAGGQEHLVVKDPSHDITAPKLPSVAAPLSNAAAANRGGTSPLPYAPRRRLSGAAPPIPLRL